jgi:hypothetical protein
MHKLTSIQQKCTADTCMHFRVNQLNSVGTKNWNTKRDRKLDALSKVQINNNTFECKKG